MIDAIVGGRIIFLVGKLWMIVEPFSQIFVLGALGFIENFFCSSVVIAVGGTSALAKDRHTNGQ